MAKFSLVGVGVKGVFTLAFLLKLTHSLRPLQWIPLETVKLSLMEPHGFSNATGGYLYVARAHRDFGHILGYYDPDQGLIVGNQEGTEEVLSKDEAEIIKYSRGAVSWIPAPDGSSGIPSDLVLGGWTRAHRYGLFICRALQENSMLVGHFVFMKPDVCTVPYKGKEVDVAEFEVLVHNMYGISRGIVL